MTLLYVISKSGTNITFVLLTIEGFDDHFNLAEEFTLLLFLLPTVFFLNIWTPIRLSYQSGNWLLRSLVAFIALTTLLAFSSPIDQRILNQSWEEYMAPYNQIVDNEIQRANSKGITFSNEAIETIRFNKKERVLIQANNLKSRFKSITSIPTDTVVLELILVKKSTIRTSYKSLSMNEANCWPYALPRHIYQQIQLTDDSIKIEYLREILQEYDSIFKTEWDFMESYGLSDRNETRSTLSRWYGEIAFELIYFNNKLKEERRN